MLRIEIVKRDDRTGVFRCTRADGSVAWQKQPKHVAFLASHDLTHFALETVLGYGRGFFGLIAEGWDLEDAGGDGARGPVPGEAIEVEKFVGRFDSERASTVRWSPEEFNSFAPRPPTDEEIGRLRAFRTDLSRRWAAVRTGEALQLQFLPTSPREG